MYVEADIEDINRELLNLKASLKWEVSKKEKYDYKSILPFYDVQSLSNLLKSKLEISKL